jgi:hypothetical protein
MEAKYLILSTENNCIYTWTNNDVVANAINDGDMDSLIRVITKHNSLESFEKLNTADLTDTYAVNLSKNTVAKISNTDVSESWLNQKNILLFRQKCFDYWHTTVVDAFSRISPTVWQSFEVIALDQINKCDPSINYYIPAIEEYANILGKSLPDTYKDLKLTLESNFIKKFRIQALADKWKSIINSTTDVDSFESIKLSMNQDFWHFALI